ncbi:MAG: hypothetical protein COC15_02970 [Legionellales bacterium]|nr:MAG: hypothetical protein COC15_02970 [Legionellales bacterium]
MEIVVSTNTQQQNHLHYIRKIIKHNKTFDQPLLDLHNDFMQQMKNENNTFNAELETKTAMVEEKLIDIMKTKTTSDIKHIAEYLVECFISGENKPAALAYEFINSSKYHPEQQELLEQTIKSLYGEYKKTNNAKYLSGLEKYWRAIQVEPRDSSNVYHMALVVRLLDVCKVDISVSTHKQLLEDMINWSDTCIKEQLNLHEDYHPFIEIFIITLAKTSISKNRQFNEMLHNNLASSRMHIKKNALIIISNTKHCLPKSQIILSNMLDEIIDKSIPLNINTTHDRIIMKDIGSYYDVDCVDMYVQVEEAISIAEERTFIDLGKKILKAAKNVSSKLNEKIIKNKLYTNELLLTTENGSFTYEESTSRLVAASFFDTTSRYYNNNSNKMTMDIANKPGTKDIIKELFNVAFNLDKNLEEHDSSCNYSKEVIKFGAINTLREMCDTNLNVCNNLWDIFQNRNNSENTYAAAKILAVANIEKTRKETVVKFLLDIFCEDENTNYLELPVIRDEINEMNNTLSLDMKEELSSNSDDYESECDKDDIAEMFNEFYYDRRFEILDILKETKVLQNKIAKILLNSIKKIFTRHIEFYDAQDCIDEIVYTLGTLKINPLHLFNEIFSLIKNGKHEDTHMQEDFSKNPTAFIDFCLIELTKRIAQGNGDGIITDLSAIIFIVLSQLDLSNHLETVMRSLKMILSYKKMAFAYLHQCIFARSKIEERKDKEKIIEFYLTKHVLGALSEELKIKVLNDFYSVNLESKEINFKADKLIDELLNSENNIIKLQTAKLLYDVNKFDKTQLIQKCCTQLDGNHIDTALVECTLNILFSLNIDYEVEELAKILMQSISVISLPNQIKQKMFNIVHKMGFTKLDTISHYVHISSKSRNKDLLVKQKTIMNLIHVTKLNADALSAEIINFIVDYAKTINPLFRCEAKQLLTALHYTLLAQDIMQTYKSLTKVIKSNSSISRIIYNYLQINYLELLNKCIHCMSIPLISSKKLFITNVKIQQLVEPNKEVKEGKASSSTMMQIEEKLDNRKYQQFIEKTLYEFKMVAKPIENITQLSSIKAPYAYQKDKELHQYDTYIQLNFKPEILSPLNGKDLKNMQKLGEFIANTFITKDGDKNYLEQYLNFIKLVKYQDKYQPVLASMLSVLYESYKLSGKPAPLTLFWEQVENNVELSKFYHMSLIVKLLNSIDDCNEFLVHKKLLERMFSWIEACLHNIGMSNQYLHPFTRVFLPNLHFSHKIKKSHYLDRIINRALQSEKQYVINNAYHTIKVLSYCSHDNMILLNDMNALETIICVGTKNTDFINQLIITFQNENEEYEAGLVSKYAKLLGGIAVKLSSSEIKNNIIHSLIQKLLDTESALYEHYCYWKPVISQVLALIGGKEVFYSLINIINKDYIKETINLLARFDVYTVNKLFEIMQNPINPLKRLLAAETIIDAILASSSEDVTLDDLHDVPKSEAKLVKSLCGILQETDEEALLVKIIPKIICIFSSIKKRGFTSIKEANNCLARTIIELPTKTDMSAYSKLLNCIKQYDKNLESKVISDLLPKILKSKKETLLEFLESNINKKYNEDAAYFAISTLVNSTEQSSVTIKILVKLLDDNTIKQKISNRIYIMIVNHFIRNDIYNDKMFKSLKEKLKGNTLTNPMVNALLEVETKASAYIKLFEVALSNKKLETSTKFARHLWNISYDANTTINFWINVLNSHDYNVGQKCNLIKSFAEHRVENTILFKYLYAKIDDKNFYIALASYNCLDKLGYDAEKLKVQRMKLIGHEKLEWHVRCKFIKSLDEHQIKASSSKAIVEKLILDKDKDVVENIIKKLAEYNYAPPSTKDILIRKINSKTCAPSTISLVVKLHTKLGLSDNVIEKSLLSTIRLLLTSLEQKDLDANDSCANERYRITSKLLELDCKDDKLINSIIYFVNDPSCYGSTLVMRLINKALQVKAFSKRVIACILKNVEDESFRYTTDYMEILNNHKILSLSFISIEVINIYLKRSKNLLQLRQPFIAELMLTADKILIQKVQTKNIANIIYSYIGLHYLKVLAKYIITLGVPVRSDQLHPENKKRLLKYLAIEAKEYDMPTNLYVNCASIFATKTLKTPNKNKRKIEQNSEEKISHQKQNKKIKLVKLLKSNKKEKSSGISNEIRLHNTISQPFATKTLQSFNKNKRKAEQNSEEKISHQKQNKKIKLVTSLEPKKKEKTSTTPVIESLEISNKNNQDYTSSQST